jgi:hypothetical protein
MKPFKNGSPYWNFDEIYRELRRAALYLANLLD